MSAPLPHDIGSAQPSPGAEAEIVALVRAGNERAFDALVVEYGNSMVRYAMALLGAPDDADDVVQAVFVRVWQMRGQWRVTSSIRTYLLSAVRHETISRHRREQSADRVAEAVRRDIDFRGGDGAHATDVSQAIVERAELHAGLTLLPLRRREAVVLRYGFGMTAAQVAHVMGATPKAVELLAVRGLRTLRDWFGRRGPSTG